MNTNFFTKDGTAQGVAKQRLIESLAKPNKRIIYDPYAQDFVFGASLIKLMGHKLNVWLTKKFIPGFHEHLISRTRFIDDLIERSAAQGTEQYVILGAGYDLRAHRLAIPNNMKIFEVDQPSVQKRKQAKLSKKTPNSENITYVGVDFNHQTLREQLLNAGFDKNKSTVFTLEGVSQYLSKAAINTTIKTLAELSMEIDSTFFISYVDPLIHEKPENCFGVNYHNPKQKVETIMRLAAKVGEPWISFYSAKEMENLLLAHGFTLTANKTLADLNKEYFTPVGRTLPEHHILKLEHFVIAESKK